MVWYVITKLLNHFTLNNCIIVYTLGFENIAIEYPTTNSLFLSSPPPPTCFKIHNQSDFWILPITGHWTHRNSKWWLTWAIILSTPYIDCDLRPPSITRRSVPLAHRWHIYIDFHITRVLLTNQRSLYCGNTHIPGGWINCTYSQSAVTATSAVTTTYHEFSASHVTGPSWYRAFMHARWSTIRIE
jgi:hypothetical protein